ncbi:FecR family protein [Chitinophaga rupis]|uniref:FecR family protein n=1 Tax=Chitinophaga rupis TaxID=573321 RepID=A0A1H7XY62_9BACT|nr:FecR domain-containing protein [Chitinophaga rupis]SEM38896.1 FecR family protein [Chitinophaga rupis]
MVDWNNVCSTILAILNRMLGKAQDTAVEETVKNPHKIRSYFRRLKKYIPLFKKLQPLFYLLVPILLFTPLYNRPLHISPETLPGANSNNAENSIRIDLPDESTVIINDSLGPVDVTVDVDSLAHAITVRHKNNKKKPIRITIPKGKSMRIRLRDGSKVHLNSSTTFEYPVAWEEHRDVYLNGEGYFEVTKNEKQAFIVYSKNMDITVLGTSFNVNNYPDMENSEVTVVEGRVLIKSKQDSTVLSGGKNAIINQLSGKILVERSRQTPESGWNKGLYIYYNKPLKMICKDLTRLYNTNIIIDDPTIASLRFTGICNFRDPIIEFLSGLVDITDEVYYYRDYIGQWHVQKKSSHVFNPLGYMTGSGHNAN